MTPFIASMRLASALAGILLGLGACYMLKRHPEEIPYTPILPPVQIPRTPTALPPPPAQTPAVAVAEPEDPLLTIQEAMDFVAQNEGYSSRVYECSAGKATIGYGFNLDAPGAKNLASSLGINLESGKITKGQARKLFRAKMDEAFGGARRLFDDFDARPKDVQLAIVDMIYNLGVTGFRKCYGTYHALKNEDYLVAANRMRRTAWSRQVGDRAAKLADMVEAIASR